MRAAREWNPKVLGRISTKTSFAMIVRFSFSAQSPLIHCRVTVSPSSIQHILWDSPVAVLILCVVDSSQQTYYPISAYGRYAVQCHFFFTMGQQPPIGQGLLIIEASQSHSDTPQSVGLLRTSDQLVAETSTCTTHSTHNRQTSMLPIGIRTHNLSRRAAADPRLRPRGHWDQRYNVVRANTDRLLAREWFSWQRQLVL